MGNNNYGWFATGYPGTSAISRIDYSNDNTTSSPRGNFWITAYNSAGTGNADYGYVASGNDPSNGVNSQTVIGRIDYSNDTATSTPRGNVVHPKAIRNQNGLSAEANGLPN